MRIVDVIDGDSFDLVPPCADPAFDHRTCDYWENPETGSKAARPSWLRAAESHGGPEERTPGAADSDRVQPVPRRGIAREACVQSVRPAGRPGWRRRRRLALGQPVRRSRRQPVRPPPRPTHGPQAGAPRKLALLQRGLGVSGRYAKVLLADGIPAAYAQFGPLTAYPRALALRDLYPQLPSSPLPAVITCVATTTAARGMGYAQRLVEAICRDLAELGFTAVEAYPEPGASADATSAASSGFWRASGFTAAVDDPRFPAMRREL